jgi:hypothetical protein
VGVAEDGTERTAPRVRDRSRAALLTGSLSLLVLVGVLGESAAKPGLGDRGWAPGGLPWTASSAWTTAMLAAAYLLGAAAVARGLVRPPRHAWPWLGAVALGLLLLTTQPFGSADHTNYVAYGQIALHGGDPYAVSPADWMGGTDPVAGQVEPPWSDTPSVYGPVATALAAFAAWGGQDNLRQAVWCWQVVVVLAWLAVRWLAQRLTTDHARVDVLWTANPLVVGVLVLGSHVDVVAAALAAAALVLATRWPWWGPALAGLAAGAAFSTKITYGVVVVALGVGWFVAGRRPGGDSRPTPLRVATVRTLIVVGVAAAVALPLHLAAGTHVLDQMRRSRRAISLATPWRILFEQVRDLGPEGRIRILVISAAALACVVLALLLWRLTSGLVPDTPTGQAVRAAAVASTAYVLGAPYSLPWYDALAWATVPAVALAGAVAAVSTLDVVLLGWATVVTLAYVPGRVVDMSADVESLTLGFRTEVAPWLVLLVWAGVAVAAVRPWRVLLRPDHSAAARSHA